MVELEEAQREKINNQSKTAAHGWAALFNSGLFKADTDPARWLPFPPKDSKSDRMSPRTTATFKRLIAQGTIQNRMVLASAMMINNALIPLEEEF